MARTHDRLPQFNWPVFGPFLGIVITILVVVGVLAVRLLPESDGGGPTSVANGVNPDRDAPLPANPGRGGPEPVAPTAVRTAIYSLSARVVGTPTVRRGPGTQFAAVYALESGQEVHVIACSPGCEWLRLFSPTDATAQLWLPAVFLNVSGNVATLPVQAPQ